MVNSHDSALGVGPSVPRGGWVGMPLVVLLRGRRAAAADRRPRGPNERWTSNRATQRGPGRRLGLIAGETVGSDPYVYFMQLTADEIDRFWSHVVKGPGCHRLLDLDLCRRGRWVRSFGCSLCCIQCNRGVLRPHRVA